MKVQLKLIIYVVPLQRCNPYQEQPSKISELYGSGYTTDPARLKSSWPQIWVLINSNKSIVGGFPYHISFKKKDNLAKHKFHGSFEPYFCHHDDIIKHLSLQCSSLFNMVSHPNTFKLVSVAQCCEHIWQQLAT
jgi:hypothetical protein